MITVTDIRTIVLSALTGAQTFDQRVKFYDSRTRPIERNEPFVVVVHTNQTTTPDPHPNPAAFRARTDLSIEVHARGSSAASAASNRDVIERHVLQALLQAPVFGRPLDTVENSGCLKLDRLTINRDLDQSAEYHIGISRIDTEVEHQDGFGPLDSSLDDLLLFDADWDLSPPDGTIEAESPVTLPGPP